MTTIAQSICFNLPAGAEYCGRLLKFSHNNDRIQATIEVEPDVWESIDLVEMFNLRLDVRKPGSVTGTKAVQLEIVLSSKIYQALKAEGRLLTDDKAFLASDPSHPMRSVLNWFAIEVTEEIALPESLRDKGTLREGFTTKWKDEL